MNAERIGLNFMRPDAGRPGPYWEGGDPKQRRVSPLSGMRSEEGASAPSFRRATYRTQ